MVATHKSEIAKLEKIPEPKAVKFIEGKIVWLNWQTKKNMGPSLMNSF